MLFSIGTKITIPHEFLAGIIWASWRCVFSEAASLAQRQNDMEACYTDKELNIFKLGMVWKDFLSTKTGQRVHNLAVNCVK